MGNPAASRSGEGMEHLLQGLPWRQLLAAILGALLTSPTLKGAFETCRIASASTACMKGIEFLQKGEGMETELQERMETGSKLPQGSTVSCLVAKWGKTMPKESKTPTTRSCKCGLHDDCLWGDSFRCS